MSYLYASYIIDGYKRLSVTKICKKKVPKCIIFSSKNNSIAGKGRYRIGRGVLVFEAGLEICSWLNKIRIFSCFIYFYDIFFSSNIFGYRG
jgi:hypothetical protein